MYRDPRLVVDDADDDHAEDPHRDSGRFADNDVDEGGQGGGPDAE